MVASLMQTLLIPIQSELPRLLDASRDATAWVITVTLLVSAICNPIAGRLGDMFGKRRVMLVLIGLLTVGSIVCAIAPGVELMIVGRALQGSGMGVIALGIAILRDVVEPRRLAGSVALVSATLGIGGAIGLPLAAFIAQTYDWRMLFWTAAGLGLVLLLVVSRIVPESVQRAGGRFDALGALGLGLGLTGVLLALSKGDAWGWFSPWTLLSLGGGVVVLLVWGWFELRVGSPLVDLRVSARARVLMTNIASVAMGFALFTSSIAFPQLLQLPRDAGGFGLTLLDASLVLVPAGLAMLVMSPVAGRISRVAGPKVLLVAGAAVLSAVYLTATFAPLSVPVILLLNACLGVGVGLAYAAMPSLIMSAVPRHETAAANGLNTLMRGLGTSIAAAVVAAVLAQGAGAVPSAASFTIAFAFGFAAALLAAIVAVFIPKAPAV